MLGSVHLGSSPTRAPGSSSVPTARTWPVLTVAPVWVYPYSRERNRRNNRNTHTNIRAEPHYINWCLFHSRYFFYSTVHESSFGAVVSYLHITGITIITQNMGFRCDEGLDRVCGVFVACGVCRSGLSAMWRPRMSLAPLTGMDGTLRLCEIVLFFVLWII